MQHARKMGLAIGLASSSSRDWVSKHLQQLKITEFFDCLRVKEDVRKVKPDPELYLQVLEQLNIEPQFSIAFEDSPNGAAAAKRAGMYCVIVPNDLTKQLTFSKFDLRLESMAQKRMEQVVSYIEQLSV